MKPFPLIILLIFFISGGCIGLLVGQKTAPKEVAGVNCVPASHEEIDSFYTTTLGVTNKQKQALAPIEKEYLKKKQNFTAQMAEANFNLANIIEEKGYEAPEVAHAVMEIHKAMGDLQHLTLQHLAEVKGVLTQEQAELLKNHVVQRLRQNL
jgi:hypothetical protein